jgi:hypothetical protein
MRECDVRLLGFDQPDEILSPTPNGGRFGAEGIGTAPADHDGLGPPFQCKADGLGMIAGGQKYCVSLSAQIVDDLAEQRDMR